ncbi:MAG: hypothetical protein IRY87_36010 [Acetobacteraceae bacterium]|nr:hypothetical protein [Acetobacteraceae bacterium]
MIAPIPSGEGLSSPFLQMLGAPDGRELSATLAAWRAAGAHEEGDALEAELLTAFRRLWAAASPRARSDMLRIIQADGGAA